MKDVQSVKWEKGQVKLICVHRCSVLWKPLCCWFQCLYCICVFCKHVTSIVCFVTLHVFLSCNRLSSLLQAIACPTTAGKFFPLPFKCLTPGHLLQSDSCDIGVSSLPSKLLDCHRSPVAWRAPAVGRRVRYRKWQAFHSPDVAAVASVCSNALTQKFTVLWALCEEVHLPD